MMRCCSALAFPAPTAATLRFHALPRCIHQIDDFSWRALPPPGDGRVGSPEKENQFTEAMESSRVTNRAHRTPVPAPSYSPAAASSTRIRRPGSLGYCLPRLPRITMPSFRVGIIPIYADALLRPPSFPTLLPRPGVLLSR